jgi:hypothetical protein
VAQPSYRITMVCLVSFLSVYQGVNNRPGFGVGLHNSFETRSGNYISQECRCTRTSLSSAIFLFCLRLAVITTFMDGMDGLQVWRVAAKILNKQLRTYDKGLSSIFEGLTTPHRKKSA